MAVHLKPIEEQTIVITGASSGIGLVTARMAARRGAKVILVAREEDSLKEAVEDIRSRGGQAAYAVADVGDEAQINAAADMAKRTFGGFDTWVNNAGVTVFGRIHDIPMADQRRLFETNYWGAVTGSLIAAEYLKTKGGALINIGSVLSDRAIIDQGPYCASKHALKGFTNSLRMELEADRYPVSVTLIKPGPIDTMFEDHGRNRMGADNPSNPPPVYAPETVARAIIHAAQHPIRDLIIGSSGKLLSASETLFPRLMDFAMENYVQKIQRSGQPTKPSDSLYGPSIDGQERSGRHSFARERSYYTEAQMHPWMTLAIAVGAGAVIAGARGGIRTMRSRSQSRIHERALAAGFQ